MVRRIFTWTDAIFSHGGITIMVISIGVVFLTTFAIPLINSNPILVLIFNIGLPVLFYFIAIRHYKGMIQKRLDNNDPKLADFKEDSK